jgi:hypothetical protein
MVEGSEVWGGRAVKIVDADYFKKIMAIRAPAVAAVLNPRLRLYYFQRLLQDGSTAIGTFTQINNHFKNSYGAYKRQQKEVEEAKRIGEEDTYGFNDSPIRPSIEDPTLEQLIDPFFIFEDDRVFNDVSEESRYLAEKLAPMKTPKFDSEGKEVVEPDTAIQEYWQRKGFEYPILSRMARDFLRIPATSAPSERVFSDSGNTITKKRCKLAPESIRYVVCLRSWGLLEEDDLDVEEEDIEGDGDSDGDKGGADSSMGKTLFYYIDAVFSSNQWLRSIPLNLRPSHKAPLLRIGHK